MMTSLPTVEMECQTYDITHDQVVHDIVPLEDNDKQNDRCPMHPSTDQDQSTSTTTLQSDPVNADRYLYSNYHHGETMQMIQPYFTHDYFPMDNVNHFGQSILTDQHQGSVSTPSNMPSSGHWRWMQNNCMAHDAHIPQNSNSLQYHGQLV